MDAHEKSVRCFFFESKFLIPDYQRPYAWGLEECQTLWDDLVSFSEENKDSEPKKPYFLGSIVTFTNEDTLEVIDGQQRIITLLLLYAHFIKI